MRSLSLAGTLQPDVAFRENGDVGPTIGGQDVIEALHDTFGEQWNEPRRLVRVYLAEGYDKVIEVVGKLWAFYGYCSALDPVVRSLVDEETELEVGDHDLMQTFRELDSKNVYLYIEEQ